MKIEPYWGPDGRRVGTIYHVDDRITIIVRDPKPESRN